MRLNFEVGEEVYLKVKVTCIKACTTDGKDDRYIDFEYPHWFKYKDPSLQMDRGRVLASQHLIYGLVEEEES